ncbi:helix-turn-helix domain-containing protein [Pseudoalteromonas luteoviolacea]|uniref:HTH araC/xylS-type domain-containing protein n=1 Tax=Pseudoalteromonas luteoviolacea H33 TaxID=1365251 RepID=A0A167DYA2_9GAMM|nr:AraC family transcriptional regulator [Pseudoalteromonas luteoviolacea]KZN49748.1 hypothetical protein N476_18320 [Pseudoalteromonas luteoviolacea H33]KZN77772.1 hypothetical protein N477_00775 [Pseudoalteromonas luteoviolacea H33-S]
MIDFIMIKPVNLLQCLFIFLGIFGTLLLWGQKRLQGVAALLLYYSVLMLLNLLEELNITKPLFFITPALTLLLGPILYFMSRQMVGFYFQANWRVICHIVPTLMALPFTHHTQVVIAIATISQLIYIYQSEKLLNKFNWSIFNTRSDAENLQLCWLNYTLMMLAFIFIIDLVRLNVRSLTSEVVYYHWYFIDLALIFCILCFMVLRLSRQSQLNGQAEPPAISDTVHLHKTLEELNNSELAQKLFDEIHQAVMADSLYLQAKLSVNDICARTQIKTKDISWAINTATNKNFNDYVNELRVKEVQKQLSARRSSQYTLLDIAFNAGFNSKSAFNSAFKRFTNMTPSAYAKLHTRGE